MSEQKITGIDLAKTNFYLFSINTHGKPAGKIKLSRNQLLNWLAQQPKMTVAMEAWGHPNIHPKVTPAEKLAMDLYFNSKSYEEIGSALRIKKGQYLFTKTK